MSWRRCARARPFTYGPRTMVKSVKRPWQVASAQALCDIGSNPDLHLAYLLPPSSSGSYTSTGSQPLEAPSRSQYALHEGTHARRAEPMVPRRRNFRECPCTITTRAMAALCDISWPSRSPAASNASVFMGIFAIAVRHDVAT